MFLSRFSRGTFSQIINSTYSTYYIILTPAILWYLIIILHISQYGRHFWSRIRCVGIPCLQGCMVCCSWNFMITTIIPKSNSCFFKKTIGPNLDKTWNSTQYSIFRHALSFSYVPCITVLLSIMVSTIYWLYIIINSINSWGQQRSTLAWQNSITITKTIIFFHVFANFETLKQCHFVNA